MADHERPLVGLDEVDVAVRACRAGAVARVRMVSSSTRRVVPVEERERGLVERRAGTDRRCSAGPATERPSGLARYSARSAISTSASLVRAVVRVAGDPDADGDVRAAGRPGQLGDAAPDPVGDLVGGRPVGVGEDDRRTRRRRSDTGGRRPGWPPRARPPTATRSASPAGWPQASLNALKPSRSSISTANGSPADAALHDLARARAGRRRGCAGRSARRGRPGSGRRRAPRRSAARSRPGRRTAGSARTRSG